MSRPLFALIVVAVIALAFLGMWLGWRARARRDAGVRASALAPTGPILAEFSRVLYVSTTPVGQPLTRVAAPGLRYRGQAEITVHADGVTVAVVGEQPTYFAAGQLRGSGAASRRVGKAVEHDGLALLRWESASDAQELESCFRFEHKAEQQRFAEVIETLTHSAADDSAAPNSNSQEDAK